MRIIVDAMGGDNAPRVPVEAGIKAAELLTLDIVLVGKENVIRSEMEKCGYCGSRVTVVNADEIIANDEEPVSAVRRKKNASLTVAARMLANGDGDAMVSMGSTGAILAAGLLIVGRIKGILRPALATLLPTEKGPKLLIDAGANTNCRSGNLVQFAVMGHFYMQRVLKTAEPAVGLVSNGEEEGKGDSLTKEAYKLLKEEKINFIGNIEGRDIMTGRADVIVTDGFVGNVILKTIEGMGSVVGTRLKNIFKRNVFSALGALLVKGGIDEFKKTMDYREYGGAPLLGIKRPIIKSHGSSEVYEAFKAIEQTKKYVEANVNEEIALYLEARA